MGWQAQLLGKKKHATKDWEHRKWVNEAVYTFKAHTTTVVEENCQPVHLENSMGVEGLRADPETVTEQQEWRKTGENSFLWNSSEHVLMR